MTFSASKTHTTKPAALWMERYIHLECGLCGQRLYTNLRKFSQEKGGSQHPGRMFGADVRDLLVWLRVCRARSVSVIQIKQFASHRSIFSTPPMTGSQRHLDAEVYTNQPPDDLASLTDVGVNGTTLRSFNCTRDCHQGLWLIDAGTGIIDRKRGDEAVLFFSWSILCVSRSGKVNPA